MFRTTVTILILSVFLILVAGCEVDQAVTGIRISNDFGDDIDSVKIGPSPVRDFSGLPELLTSSIPDQDFREFELIVGTFDVQVEAWGGEFFDTRTLEVTQDNVTEWVIIGELR